MSTCKVDRVREFMAEKGITGQDMICRPCRQDITRVLSGDSSYRARWEKRAGSAACCVKDYTEQVLSSYNVTLTKTALDTCGLQFKEEAIPKPIPLCTHHYHTLYKFVTPQPNAHCPTCDAPLRHLKTRFCPQPSVIEAHLRDKTSFDGSISSTDRVCLSCYKYHLSILQEESKLSHDSDLRALLDSVRNRVCSTEVPSTPQQIDNLAMDKTILCVGHELLQHQAVLLPAAHSHFLQFHQQLLLSSCVVHEQCMPRTAMWVFSNLVSTLGQHIEYSCTIRKYGTLMYRPHTDLASLLQKALWKLGQQSGKSFMPTSDKEKLLDHLNDCVHQQCLKFIHNAPEFLDSYETFSIKKAIDDINPDLWDTICGLTRSPTERSRQNHSADSLQVKNMRRLFLLCSILFCTDDRCSLPFHVLITDLVHSQGGTSQLIRILNRLGVCASADTLSRFVESKIASDKGQQQLSEFYDSDSFAIVSVDNIDYVHKNARVAKGKANSWHGTTVQVVKPLPSLSPIYEVPTSPMSPNPSASRKRPERASNTESPMQLTKSPVTKALRRERTENEGGVSFGDPMMVPYQPDQPDQRIRANVSRSLDDFTLNHGETDALCEAQKLLFSYMLSKKAVVTGLQDDANSVVITFQHYMDILKATHTEKSAVGYIRVIDAVADSKDTVLHLLSHLHDKFIKNRSRDHLAVAGDQKLFEVFQSLKEEYGGGLDWVIPIPGDWHLLKTYQMALMKPYFDAGLKDLAKAAGYPVASIQACSNFKRTHQFLIEAWEALFRVMLDKFHDQTSGHQDMLQQISDKLLSSTQQPDLPSRLESLAHITSANFDSFKDFVQNLACKDDTWRFWVQCVFEDMMAYICLYLALRSGDWQLRVACIKKMAPVFTAFDHVHYVNLIAQHLADLLTMPQSMLTMFEQGAFVVSISGTTHHSVAMDEAHEMLINKSCKASIVRPSQEQLRKLVHYLPYRTKSIENLLQQLFPPSERGKLSTSLITTNSDERKREGNVQTQVCAIESSGLLELPESNRGLINPFSKSIASLDQAYDLLHFRTIGQNEFLSRVASTILHKPSSAAPLRKGHLKTFTIKTSKSRKVTQLEKDRKLILACMRKKIKFSLRTGTPIATAAEQLISLPLALCDSQGNLQTGQKCYITKALDRHYINATPRIFLYTYPAGWTSQCCLILEGMFLINTEPLGSQTSFDDYANFLMHRHVVPHFKRGCKEVHLLFDNPGTATGTPKFFEQKRRDQVSIISPDHACPHSYKGSDTLPGKWREDLVHCRTCKRHLVCFLTDYMLGNIHAHILPEQKLYLAGAFSDQSLTNTAWFARGSKKPNKEPEPIYSCNTEETDMRIWLHAEKTSCSRVLIVSPDTDVYFIGMPLPCTIEKDIMIRISKVTSKEIRLLHLNALLTALKHDPNLSSICPSQLAKIMQVLYVVTGCDYTSFFYGIGKATFLRIFFQHAKFITATLPHTQGSLCNTSLDNEEHTLGFLAFLRLVGTAYFKKYSSGFDTRSPESHYKSFFSLELAPLAVHTQWLQSIRASIWDRTAFETDMVPSVDALWRHWKRSCWIIDMWRQADKNTALLKDLTSHGWLRREDNLVIDWESEGNVKAIEQRVALLTRGCKCKTGCNTLRCGCRKKGERCCEGCACLHCNNLPAPTTQTQTPLPATEVNDIELEENNLEGEFDPEIEMLMRDIFHHNIILNPTDRNNSDSEEEIDIEEEVDNDISAIIFGNAN